MHNNSEFNNEMNKLSKQVDNPKIFLNTERVATEIDGWEDWMWFHFDEIFGCMYDVKLGSRGMLLNLVKENQYFAGGEFTIEHHKWTYFHAQEAFIPKIYKIKMRVEAGTLEFTAKVSGTANYGVAAQSPNKNGATLYWDELEGVFTYKDGREKILTGGLGGASIGQFKP